MQAHDDIQAAFTAQLTQTDGCVLSLTGDWGIGKTWFWHHTLWPELRNKCPKTQYAYVSLFGLNSLNELQQSIYLTSEPLRTNGEDVSLTEAAKKLASKAAPLLKPLTGALLPDAANTVLSGYSHQMMQAQISDYLIVLDDLERSGDGLKIKDVMGYISYLKEEKNCHVVIITNQDQMKDDDYQRYSEKVIDYTYRFPADSDYSLDIGFLELKERDMSIQTHYREACDLLNLHNIRVIHKLQHYDDAIHHIITQNQYSNDTYRRAIYTLPLLLAMQYLNHENKYPDFLFLKALNGFDYTLKENRTPQEETWDTLLSRYKLQYIEPIVHEIHGMLQKGYPHVAQFENLLQDIDHEITQGSHKEALSTAWRQYNNRLCHDKNEFITTMQQAVKDHGTWAVPSQISSIVFIFRELGEDSKADAIIDTYITQRGDWLQQLSDDSNDLYKMYEFDKRLREEIERLMALHRDQRPLIEVLEHIGIQHAIDDTDCKRLLAIDEKKYVDTFKTIETNTLKVIIQEILKYKDIPDAPPEYKAISKKAIAVFQTVAKENEMAALKLKYYGVPLKSSDYD